MSSSLLRVGHVPEDLDHFYRGARTAFSSVERTRPPRFLGNPCVHAPLLDPDGPPTPGHHGVSNAAFRSLNDVGSASISLTRLYHAACTLPVYASQLGSPPDHATLGSGWWPTFTGSGLSPAGSLREVSVMLTSCYRMSSASPRLCLAQQSHETHPTISGLQVVRIIGSYWLDLPGIESEGNMPVK